MIVFLLVCCIFIFTYFYLLSLNREHKMTKQVILMMGGPASGKSYIRTKMFDGIKVIDCDEIKKEHPEYDGHNPTMEIHAWSSVKALQLADDSIKNKESFIYDGTGSTAEKYVKIIKKAHQAGFNTKLVYVVCDLKTALERNKNRKPNSFRRNS